MLPDPGRGQDDPFGTLLWPVTFGGATDNLVPQGALEYRRAQLALAEEGKLAAVLEVEEIGQAVTVDAFGAGGAQQQTVDISEPGAVLSEDGPGQDVPFAARPRRTHVRWSIHPNERWFPPLPHSALRGR
jgi:hypothetical protein